MSSQKAPARGRDGLASRLPAAAVVHEDRQGAPRGIAVVLAHQGGHVEQVGVEALGREQGHRGAGDHVQVRPGVGDGGLREGAVGVRLEGDGAPPSRTGGDQRDVAGDEGHPSRRGQDRRGVGRAAFGRRGRGGS
jgi:hypothetical protein